MSEHSPTYAASLAATNDCPKCGGRTARLVPADRARISTLGEILECIACGEQYEMRLPVSSPASLAGTPEQTPDLVPEAGPRNAREVILAALQDAAAMAGARADRADRYPADRWHQLMLDCENAERALDRALSASPASSDVLTTAQSVRCRDCGEPTAANGACYRCHPIPHDPNWLANAAKSAPFPPSSSIAVPTTAPSVADVIDQLHGEGYVVLRPEDLEFGVREDFKRDALYRALRIESPIPMSEKVVRHPNGHLQIERVEKWVPSEEEIAKALASLDKAYPYLEKHASHIDGEFNLAFTHVRDMFRALRKRVAEWREAALAAHASSPASIAEDTGTRDVETVKGERWSFARKCVQQGYALQWSHIERKGVTYEQSSAELDALAASLADEPRAPAVDAGTTDAPKLPGLRDQLVAELAARSPAVDDETVSDDTKRLDFFDANPTATLYQTTDNVWHVEVLTPSGVVRHFKGDTLRAAIDAARRSPESVPEANNG